MVVQLGFGLGFVGSCSGKGVLRLGFAPPSPPSSPEPQEVPSANMASPGGPAAQAAAAALANALGVVARWSVGLGIAGSVAQASLFDVDGGTFVI